MAMAHLSSSEHLASKGFSGSPYMRNSSHMVGSSHSSLSLSSSEFASKYLMESSGYPSTECPAAAWQIGAGSDMHFLPSEASMKVSVASLQAQQGATFGSEVLGEWQQFMDPGIQYSSAMPTPSALPPSSNAVIPTHNPEASTGRPLTNMSSGLSYAPSSLTLSPTQGVEKGGANAWATSSGLSLTVDPSKGGLALQGIASQCFAEFPSDPGFVERAARYSSFHNSGYGQQSPNKLSRTSSFRADSSANGADDAVKNVLDEGKLYSKLQKASQEAGLSPSKEDSLSSAPNSMEQGNRKRKAASEERSKDAATPIQKDSKNAESEEAKIKRQKGSEGSKDRDETKTKGEKSSSENSGSSSPKSKKDNPKPPEPPKQDYIHVRARRGQATDSHSLAERVRREKISERMKFLQDLVPGCSKVTGKAVMLDEIINYVQSLQRQVEFLSMKLAAVNPRLDINLDGLLTKEVLHGRGSPSPVVLNHDITTNYSHIQQQLQHAQQAVMQLGTSGLDLRSLGNSVENSLRTPVVNPDAFGDATSQASSVWDGELQSVVQMSFGVSPQGRPMTSQELQGHLPAGHMKVEN